MPSTKTAAVIALTAAPLAFTATAQADSSTCSQLIYTTCMTISSVDGYGKGNQLDYAQFYNRTERTQKLRFAALQISTGQIRWASRSYDVPGGYSSPASRVTSCKEDHGGQLIGNGNNFATPCHIWPASGYRIVIQNYNTGSWQQSAGTLDIKSKV